MIFLILGVVGDFLKWWENLSFTVNILSSFTGFMFAIPLALLVVSRLSEAHALLADRRRAREYARRAVADLADSYRVLRTINQSMDPWLERPIGDFVGFFFGFRAAIDKDLDILESRWRMVKDEVPLRYMEVGLPGNDGPRSSLGAPLSGIGGLLDPVFRDHAKIRQEGLGLDRERAHVLLSEFSESVRILLEAHQLVDELRRVLLAASPQP
ncbi:hypothetical protein [Streptomyces yangpuensis]|uniref:hypothetical protein n=1 Tax=Streptomyces yangpuensis TaxID=1648182 RepID=UPI0038173141